MSGGETIRTGRPLDNDCWLEVECNTPRLLVSTRASPVAPLRPCGTEHQRLSPPLSMRHS